MIRRALLLAAGVTALGQTARAQDAPEAPIAPGAPDAPVAPAAAVDHEPDTTLSAFRTPFDALTERAIGRASRRVRFDWRRGNAQVAAIGGLPAELNNYDSLRAGGVLRMPSAGMLLELGLHYVWVSGSESTDRVALTPYRQPGRPDRLEIDVGLAYPIAEGIVTAFPAFAPATQLVLNAHAQFRYLVYPGGYSDLNFLDTLKAIVSGRLSDAEIENLEDDRLPGMEIDRGRYALLVGIGNDIYLQSGFFLSHKLLIAVPLLNFMTDTQLGFGFQLDMALGLAF